MASADEYAAWIVANKDKRGTPEFDTVAKAYEAARGEDEGGSEDAVSYEPPKQRSFKDSYKRQVGLTARAGLEGLGGLATLPATLIDSASTALGGPEIFSGAQTQKTISGALDRLGLPKPQGAWEAVGGAGARGMVEAVAPAGLISKAKNAPAHVKKLVDAIMTNQGAVAAGSGAAAGATSRENEWDFMFGSRPLTDLTASVIGGAVVPPAASFANAAGDMAADIGGTVGAAMGAKSGADRLARKAALGMAGDDRGRIVNALANRTRNIDGYEPTTAQAIAEANLGKDTQFGGSTVRLERDLTGARAAPDTLLSAKRGQAKALDDYVAGVKAKAAPLREGALREANDTTLKIGGLGKELDDAMDSLQWAMRDERRFLTEAAEQGVRADKFTPVPGMPRVAGRLSENFERVAPAKSAAGDAAQIAARKRDELRALTAELGKITASGKEPLRAENIVKRISELSNEPGKRASDIVRKTLKDTLDKINEISGADGTINADDLYTVRKEIGNTIQRYAKETANWDKRLAAGLEKDVQRSIDDAIEAAGGKGWKNYLKTYSEGMGKVERVAAIDKEAADIGRRVKPMNVENIASHKIPTAPRLLSTPIAVANYLAGAISKDATDPVVRALAEKIKDPKQYMELLTLPPPSGIGAVQGGEIGAIVEAIMRMQAAGTGQAQ